MTANAWLVTLVYSLFVVLVRCSPQGLESHYPTCVRLAAKLGWATAMLILKGVCCILGFTAPVLLALPCVAALLLLWAVVRLRRFCRKTSPVLTSMIARASKVLKPSRQASAQALGRLWLYIIWGFGSAYVAQQLPTWGDVYIIQVCSLLQSQGSDILDLQVLCQHIMLAEYCATSSGCAACSCLLIELI